MQISISDFVKNGHDFYNTKRDGRPMSVHLIGHPGEGKSTFIERGLRAFLMKRFECPVDVITDMMASRDSVDIRGYLDLVREPGKKSRSEYSLPDLYLKVMSSPAINDGIVVLFLDELMLSDHLTQKVLTPTFLDGRIGDNQFPPNVWVIGASNYQEDGAGVNRALTILTNRVITLEVFLPFAVWKKYADKQCLPPTVIDFAEFRKDLVFGNVVPRKDGPFPTPRSLTDSARFLAVRMGSGDALPMDDLTKAGVAGMIGEPAMVELFAYAADAADLPKIQDIIKDPMAAKVPPLEKMSAQYAASQLLIRGADATNINQLWVYAERLMKDMQVKIANELLNNSFGGVLFNAPSFTKWLSEHKSLVSASFT